MDKILMAVGSTRRPKLDGVRDALDAFAAEFSGPGQFEIVAVDVASGVRHTPLSREETMAGARGRAENLARVAREKREPWQYFLGLEGGLDVISEAGKRWVFLQNWAYLADATGQGAFGQSGAIALPEPLASRLIDDGIDLAEAIDAFAQTAGVRDAQGAWGVLTRGLVTRRDAVRVSVISALAAFFGSHASSG
jgi:inosine/xanthosine triphosphatase